MRLATLRSRLRKVLFGLSSPLGRRALRRGVGSAIEHQSLLQSLPTMATVIDGGSNRGQFALLARSLWPGAMIHAVEPLPEALRTIRAVFARDEHFNVFPCALGEVAGVADLHISRRSDSSSLLRIGPGQVDEFPDTGAASKLPVQVARLDDLVSASEVASPVLVKLDLQGGELAALGGATRLLASVDFVYVEVSFRALYIGQPLACELSRYLMGTGLELLGIGDVTFGRRGVIIQGDLLFGRRSDHGSADSPT